MRNDDIFRRIAPYAGMVGGLLLFAAAGLALVSGRINPALIWLLVAAGLLLIFFVAADPDRVLTLLSARQARYGSNAGVATVAFVGIFIIFNFLAVQHNQQWDFTQNGQYTLTSATEKLVKNLQQPVQIIAFYTNDPQGGAGKSDAQKLLARYTALSPKVSVQFVDPNANPATAKKYQITMAPSLVVTANGKQEIVQTADEQDLSSAIQKVESGKTPKVYFLQGHGEPSLQPASGPSFSQLLIDLKKNNLDPEPLNLLTTGKVPDDAAMVVEASPTQPYDADQQKLLLDYLNKGGRMLVMAEPFAKVDLNWLTKPYGVTVDYGVIFDFSSSIANRPYEPVIQTYEQSPVITSPLPPGGYLDTASLTLASTPPSGVTVSPIAKTTADSFAVTDPNATQIDPSKDKRGPFTIAASVEKAQGASGANATPTPTPTATPAPSSQPTRLVVFGDTAFATDTLMGDNPAIAEGNSEAAIAAMKWLTTDPNAIIIPTKAPTDRSMVLVGWQSHLLIFANALFIPALVLLGGVAVWAKRR